MQQINKLIAEFIATFTLIFLGAGSVCINALTGGQVGLTGIALAHGFAILMMVYAVGHISGAHINPAVTFAMMLTRRISGPLGLAYIVSQLAGAVVAAALLKNIFPEYAISMPYLGNPAVTTLIPTFGAGMAMMVEFVLTFLLVFVVFGTAVDERAPKSLAGVAIGLTIAADIFLGGPLTGAAMNPARAFGPAFVTHQWTQQAIYWVGPMMGAAAAALLYHTRLLKR